MLRVNYEGVSSLFEQALQGASSTAIAMLVTTTKFGETHFESWVGRLPLYDVAKDPKRLSEFVIADYFDEGFQYTKDIPCLKSLNKAVLLPVQFIAIAGLIIDCHKISQSKEEDKEQEVTITDNPIWAAVANFGSIMENIFGLEKLTDFIPEKAKKACQQVVCEELPMEHELGMKKALIYYLLRGGSKAADRYALLYFRQNWEKVNEHGQGVLGRLIAYAQSTWLNQDFSVTEGDALATMTAEGCLESGRSVVRVLKTLKKDPDLPSKVLGREEAKESKIGSSSTPKAEPQDSTPPSEPPKEPVTMEQVILIAASMGLIGIWVGRRLSRPIQRVPAAA